MEANRVEIVGESKIPKALMNDIKIINRLLDDMKKCSKYKNPEDNFEYEIID